MLSPDQKEMFEHLEQQQQAQRQVDKILKVVLPIMAFLLTSICANLNITSTLCTLMITVLAYWMVGIRRHVLWHWATALVVYCFIDNLYSFGSFNLNAYARQTGTLLIFLWIIGVSRPYIDRWYFSSKLKK
jgi:hypothetical protein